MLAALKAGTTLNVRLVVLVMIHYDHGSDELNLWQIPAMSGVSVA